MPAIRAAAKQLSTPYGTSQNNKKAPAARVSRICSLSLLMILTPYIGLPVQRLLGDFRPQRHPDAPLDPRSQWRIVRDDLPI